MLPMGWIAHVGTGPRFSQLTETEQRSMMTQWVIARAPLIWGGDPVRSNASTLVTVGAADAYNVLVRYEAPYRFEVPFAITVLPVLHLPRESLRNCGEFPRFV